MISRFFQILDGHDDLLSPPPKVVENSGKNEQNHDSEEEYNNKVNNRLNSLKKQLAIEMKVKQGAENMLLMLIKNNDKSKKLKSDAEHMYEDSKQKIDVIKMSILREEQFASENRNSTCSEGQSNVDSRPSFHGKSLEHRVDDIRHHIDIETRVAEGSRNMRKQFIVAGEKKGQQEVRPFHIFIFVMYNLMNALF